MIAIPIFFFLIFFYFHKVLSSSYIFAERDLSAFFIPPRYLWVTLVKSFQMPLWNPYNSSGIPLLATLQPGILYPPNIFYLFLPFNIVWNWIIILHFVFSGFTVYCFLRYLKASSLASFIGGVTFMLSGYLFSVHASLTHLLAVPWFPLVVMYFLKYLEGGRSRHIVLTGIFVTMEFFAGAPEIVIITFFVLGITAIFPSAVGTEKVNVSFNFKAIMLVAVTFFLLSAVQLLPFYELKAWSIRHAGLGYKEATLWSFAWKDFLQLFLPDVFGYFRTVEKYWANQSWLKTMYIGMAPFILSTFFFLSKDRKRLFLSLLIVVSFLLAMGKYTPLYSVLYHIPPFNSIRYPVKFLFLFFFVISLTAGLGLDRLRTGVEQKDSRTKIIIYSAFYAGFLFAVLWGYLCLFDADAQRFLGVHGFKPEEYNDIKFNLHNLKRFLLFTFLFCVMLLVSLRTRFNKIAMYVIAGILTMDLFLANYGFYHVVPWDWYNKNKGFAGELSKNLETERYLSTRRTNNEFFLSPIDMIDMYVTLPHYAPLFNLYSVEGVEVMKVDHHETFLSIMNGVPSISDAERFFDMSGVRYIITSYKVDDNDFKLVKSIDIGDKTAYLYEYTRCPGRFLLFPKASFVKDDKTVIERLRSNTFDPGRELILIGDKEYTHENKDLQGKVRLLSYKANRFSLQYEADGDAFLYVSDTYYPGWRAYVDGKETKIYRADLAFRAIEAPKGNHIVVFKYVPMSFYIGLALTIIGILLCIWLWRRDKAAEGRE
ncbi:MAG: Bacterial membrane protein YfhO [Syntrophorhabdus sp. PtaU1.Bin058]|nr:MAG: Bacterial membrane protein YfhO [Syntrophorhabdus sp. PtaU1.Bin058]